MPEETIAQSLKKNGVSRRDFLKLSGMLAVAVGLKLPPPALASGLPGRVARGYKVNSMIADALATKPGCR